MNLSDCKDKKSVSYFHHYDLASDFIPVSYSPEMSQLPGEKTFKKLDNIDEL